MGIPPAKAIQVITNGTTYDVTSSVATYDTDTSRFTTVEMPWWGSQSLAQTFRNTIGVGLGSPNNNGQGA